MTALLPIDLILSSHVDSAPSTTIAGMQSTHSNKAPPKMQPTKR
jgi:hypothetical protein